MEDHGELHLKATFRAFNITQIEEFVQVCFIYKV